MTIHGLLAADLALRSPGTEDFLQVMPSMADFEQSMPFMWPAKLQDLLPGQARTILTQQQRRFDRDWAMFHDAFPSGPDLREFTHAWFLLNSRTFYYETTRTLDYPWVDRLAVLPVADLFNHDAVGCAVDFSPECYTVTADRPYLAGDEVHISYGEHSNDYLLVEYGFILPDDIDRWDRICLDDVIMPRLTDEQKAHLKQRDMLGGFLYQPETPKSEKVWIALRLLTGRKPRWQRYIKGQEDADGSLALAAGGVLRMVLREYLDLVEARLGAVEQLLGLGLGLDDVKFGGDHGEMLRRRWQQIRALTERSLKLAPGI
jgi:hypothetical protein